MFARSGKSALPNALLKRALERVSSTAAVSSGEFVNQDGSGYLEVADISRPLGLGMLRDSQTYLLYGEFYLPLCQRSWQCLAKLFRTCGISHWALFLESLPMFNSRQMV